MSATKPFMQTALGGAIIATGAAVLITAAVGEPIKRAVDSGIKWSVAKFNDIFYLTLTVDTNQNPKATYAILQEMRQQNVASSCKAVVDGHNCPTYNYPPGTYVLSSNTVGTVNLKIEDGKMTIWIYRFKDLWLLNPYSYQEFQCWFNTVYGKYNSQQAVTIFFTAEGSKWSFPIFRTPRIYDPNRLTHKMREVIEDVRDFVSSPQAYQNAGIPYRRGYFLHGPNGTGKTTLSEIIAKEFGFTIYLLNLNAKDMTDNVLTNLISRLPPKSMLVLEEVDHQMDTLAQNQNNQISIGGILSAVDGPLRLNQGSIVIMSSNRFKFLPDDQHNALIRPGRMDKIVELNEPVRLI